MISRTKQLIPYEVSIIRDFIHKEIRIYTDSGRLLRPLLVVNNNKLKLRPGQLKSINSFESLKESGYIEYIDAEEEESCLIAMDPSYVENTNMRYTHC